MKNKLFLIGFISVLAFACKKESNNKTLTLQPGPADGNSMSVSAYDADPNVANTNDYNHQVFNKELAFGAFRSIDVLTIRRIFISFDLKQLPGKAEIVSAKLSLFGLSSPVTFPATQGWNNFMVRRVLENWDEETITWNNQPSTVSEHQLHLPDVTDPFSITDMDVTALVKAMRAETPDKTAGFCLRINGETGPIRTVVFASNRHDDPTKRPKLVIEYKD